MKAFYHFSYLTIITLFIFGGCSSSDQKQQSSDPFNDLPVFETTTLVEINDQEAAQNGTFYFGSKFFRDMTISGDGHYFISNFSGRHILHFDESGQFIARIGSEGKGPGEFQIPPKMDIAFQDTLFALDSRSQIASMFLYNDNEWQYANGFTLEQSEGVEPDEIIHRKNRGLAIIYSPQFRRVMNEEDKSLLRKTIQIVSAKGATIQDSVLTVPLNKTSVYSSKGGASVIQDVPFGVNSIVDVGPDDKLYHLLTSEFSIKVYDSKGQLTDQFNHSSYSIDLTEEQRWSAIEEAVSVNMGSDSENRDMKEQLFSDMPDSIHPLKNMHVDRDTGQIIVKRSELYPGPNWLLLNAEGKPLGKFNLHEAMRVFDFRNGKIIGALIEDDEEALPTVRVVLLPEI